MTRRTLARPMAWLFGALVVYASLYPFVGWRAQGANPLAFLFAPLPRYWLPFDVFSNLVGYAPLGFLLAVTALRSDGGRWAVWGAFVWPSFLSLALETLQVYLPSRVPSNVDWALNTVGGLMGAGVALGLARLGWLARWQRIRSRWFVPDAHGALLLIALWPLALLYPTSIPFGLGHIWAGLDASVAQWLNDTPLSVWWPAPSAEEVPLTWAAQSLSVALSVLGPSLLGYGALRLRWHRLCWCVLVLLGSVLWMALSHALTHGPTHAWAWLTPPVWAGVGLATVGGLAVLGASRRACAVLLACVLVAALTLLNRVPPSPYLAESLEIWAQGRFSRFHGLTQWLGWLWPYGALVHAFVQGTRRHLP